ncbi:MAG: DUF1552 domain-containing protein [Sandaracinaceae bacterium]
MTRIGRRGLLAGAGALAAPWPLGHLARSVLRAQEARPPQRFLAIFTPHGSVLESWRPSAADGGPASERDFVLDGPRSVLAPLARHQDRLVLLDGVDYRVCYETDVVGHNPGIMAFLTGAGVHPEREDRPNADSLDRVLAARWAGATPRSALRVGLLSQGDVNGWDAMCFSGDGLVREPTVVDPALLYEGWFVRSMVGGDEEARRAMARLYARRRSVLDYARADLARLRARAPAAERVRLDAHAEALRSIERRLTGEGESAAPSCDLPRAPGPLDPASLGDQEPVLAAHAELIAQAFLCDLTRVATLQVHHAGAPHGLPWLGLAGDMHHDLAHAQTGVASEPYLTLQRWYSAQVAMVLDRLAATPEGDGSMLDHTLVLWGNELGHPAAHDNAMVPLVLAGGAGGRLRTGRYLRARPHDDVWCLPGFGSGTCDDGHAFDEQVPHNRVLTSICHLLGLDDVDYVGDPRFADHPGFQGGLPGLT